MKIRKFLTVITCAMLFAGSAPAVAQCQVHEIGDSEECLPLSPEEEARLKTARMDSLLVLSKKQYDKIYKLNLKWAREDRSFSPDMPPGRGGSPDGEPPFGGRGFGNGPHGKRPPEGMGHRPPRGFSPSDVGKAKAQQREKREKKLKKVLTEEQRVIWDRECSRIMPAAPKEWMMHVD